MAPEDLDAVSLGSLDELRVIYFDFSGGNNIAQEVFAVIII